MNPPLQLNSFFLEQLSYRATPLPEFDPSKPLEERHNVDYDIAPNASGGFTVRLSLGVTAEPGKNCRCQLTLSLIGFFSMAPGTDDKTRDSMLTLNAPSILYGIARQIVAETTGNGPWGKVFLGTADFVQIAKSKSQARPAVARDTVTAVSDKPRATSK